MSRYEAPGFKRRCHKWAMCAHKGGRCVACDERVTAGTIEKFHFDHKVQVNNHNDKTDRWGGAICDWPPFTDKWFDWATRVDLVCECCHRKRHSPCRQMSLDLDAQRRIDEYDPGLALVAQSELEF